MSPLFGAAIDQFGDLLGMIRQHAGVISDAIFPVAPPNGTMALDITNFTFNARIGGTWKKVTLT